jgi:hypothetical protein
MHLGGKFYFFFFFLPFSHTKWVRYNMPYINPP